MRGLLAVNELKNTVKIQFLLLLYKLRSAQNTELCTFPKLQTAYCTNKKVILNRGKCCGEKCSVKLTVFTVYDLLYSKIVLLFHAKNSCVSDTNKTHTLSLLKV